MAFGDIDVGEHIIPSGWLGDDASVTDATAALNAGSDNWKVVKNNQRLRIQMNGIDPAGLTALTIRVVSSQGHNPTDHAMLAYIDDNSVTDVGKIVVDVSAGSGTFDFVADAAFLAQLGNLGDGFAIRITDDNQTSEILITTAQIEFVEGPTDPVLDQDGFQFIEDDGSESAATDIAAEDVNITRAADINTRLRIQVDTTIADPPSATRTLQYKEVGDAASEWRDVPLT